MVDITPEALPENSTMDFFIKWLLGHEEDELSSNPPLMPEKDEYKAVSFKITAKDFGTFDGKPEHWFPFKHKTESTLGVAGFSSLLDVHVPMSDVEGNRRLYYLLEGATNDGAASHIIKQHKVMKDGRAAWVALKDWYEGKTMAGDIAKTCRVKLQALELLPKGDANTYINEFIKLKDQLEEAGEGERPATLVEQFLDQIKDPQYEVTVSNLRMENDKTLDQCIEVIRKHDLVVTRQRIKDHRFSKIRRLNSLGNNPHNPSGSGYIPPDVWANLTPAQRQAIIQARERKKGDVPNNSPTTDDKKTDAQKARRARKNARIRERKKDKCQNSDGQGKKV